MNPLPVAVIDSGIIENAFDYPSEIHHIELKKLRQVFKNREKDSLRSHGSVVSAILTKYAPNIVIYSVRIFYGDSLSTDCGTLVRALTWCYRHRIPLINLSLGTTEERDFTKVERIVSKMTAQGQIIVSAYHTNGSVTMPASHPDVIGVRTSSELVEASFFSAFSDRKRDFVASSQHTLVAAYGQIPFITELSSSYAVPTITAALAVCMIEHPERDRYYYTEYIGQQDKKVIHTSQRGETFGLGNSDNRCSLKRNPSSDMYSPNELGKR